MVLFFFYFPIKVAGGHSLSSWGKSPTPGPRLLMITLGSSQAFPSPVNCVAHFAHQFLFFCCFTLFFASFPHYNDWSKAISATSTRFCNTVVPISLLVLILVNNTEGRQVLGWETWPLCLILTKMDTQIQNQNSTIKG